MKLTKSKIDKLWAEIIRDDVKATIIKMHKFVLEILKLEPKGEA